MPKAKEKIVVAVYKFRDQTGQYKASETGANWSTAVTQGATTILIRALEESGWFIPIERENMANLLNERKLSGQAGLSMRAVMRIGPSYCSTASFRRSYFGRWYYFL